MIFMILKKGFSIFLCMSKSGVKKSLLYKGLNFSVIRNSFEFLFSDLKQENEAKISVHYSTLLVFSRYYKIIYYS